MLHKISFMQDARQCNNAMPCPVQRDLETATAARSLVWFAPDGVSAISRRILVSSDKPDGVNDPMLKSDSQHCLPASRCVALANLSG